MYALGTLPLIQGIAGGTFKFGTLTMPQQQVLSPNSSSGGTNFSHDWSHDWTHLWFATKTWQVVKHMHLNSVTLAFHGTNINEGRPHLEAPLGTANYVTQFVQKKVDKWCAQLLTLRSIANTQHLASFSAFTHSGIHKWIYLARRVLNVDSLFKPIEHIIQIPTSQLSLAGKTSSASPCPQDLGVLA